MDFINHAIMEYAEKHTEPESELLALLNRETHLKVLSPRMLSGHFQGRLLSLFSRLKQPLFILEIGTYTGYSALCLAEGLQPHGKLITIDINDEISEIVKRYIEHSGLAHKIEQRIGDAKTIIPELPYNFDLVFIDADKRNYQVYYDLVFDQLNHGGLIIADNVLWDGHVLEDESAMDADTLALHKFNEKIRNDNRVSCLLLPVRDGLMIIQKLSH